MRRRNIAVLTLALVALTGCSKAEERVAAATQPPAPSTSMSATTASEQPPTTPFTYTETRWATETLTPAPTDTTPELVPAPARAAFSYDCYLPDSSDKVIVNTWS